MTANKQRIYQLDSVSQARIKSSVQISSLNDIIIELVKNALDAQADSISVELNYCHGFCMVQDDGHGILAQEFAEDGKLAHPYCECLEIASRVPPLTQLGTSKSNRHDNIYGRHGRYLAALSGVAMFSISSRSDDQHIHTLWLNDMGRIGQATEDGDDWQRGWGTRVNVYNLFAKFPVRSKHLTDRFTSTIEVGKEFEQLKHAVAGLILALPRPFDINIQHSSSNCKYRHNSHKGIRALLQDQSMHRDSDFACSVLQQAGYIDRNQSSSWRDSIINSNGVSIHAALSLVPVPHKLVQFISVNHEPLTKRTHSPLFDTVNAAFDASMFGALNGNVDVLLSRPQDEVEYRTGNQKSRLHQRKAVDKWPMFVIWVDTKPAIAEAFVHATDSDRSTEQLMARISTLLGLMLTEFLITYDFLRASNQQQPRRYPAVTISNDSALHSSNSQHSFESWSRIKSSSGLLSDGVLSGLPFRNQKHKKARLPQEATTGLEKNIYMITKSVPENTLVASTEQGDVIEWIDLKTSRLLQINPRTGVALPKSSQSAECLQTDGSRHKEQRGLPLSHVARNVKQYAQSRYSKDCQPIRSIALLDDAGQSLDKQTQVRGKRQLWDASGECHNANSQLEMPQMSKRTLKDATVLAQLDRKFILALVPCGKLSPSCNCTTDRQLVLIDQHAADERVKVEHLIHTFHDETITLSTPIVFEVSPTEASLLEATKPNFQRWHVFYDVTSAVQPAAQAKIADITKQQIRVTALPSAIAERCRLRPQIVIDILREEIWSDRKRLTTSNVHRAKQLELEVTTEDLLCNDRHSSHNQNALLTSYIPPRLLDLLNSRACRSAIMFNDELTLSQCTNLVTSLSKCTLPFQCAHGRPSMIVLADLSNLDELVPLAPDTIDLTTLEARTGEAFNTRRGAGLNTIDETRSFGNAFHDWAAEDDSG
ncbi:DNA mismatch repair protein [Neophaeococcomyces mojaviensis]|uniref:DNA mismatch repair protein n=1 Tax=Neophaeococcomyces mojaviensis TaxID=3383035 RepID=A0ACC2ZZ39_9EURO|nr:DNA mismatch repair protein [Knufia sp. JES_112]